MITELDNGSSLKHSVLIYNELTMLERVDITLDEKKIRATLDRKESFTRNIDSVCVLKVLYGSSSGSLKLCNCDQLWVR